MVLLAKSTQTRTASTKLKFAKACAYNRRDPECIAHMQVCLETRARNRLCVSTEQLATIKHVAFNRSQATRFKSSSARVAFPKPAQHKLAPCWRNQSNTGLLSVGKQSPLFGNTPDITQKWGQATKACTPCTSCFLYWSSSGWPVNAGALPCASQPGARSSYERLLLCAWPVPSGELVPV